jgi:hypothetical protein
LQGERLFLGDLHATPARIERIRAGKSLRYRYGISD